MCHILYPQRIIRFHSKAADLAGCPTGRTTIENDNIKGTSTGACVCITCGEAAPVGLAETKGDVGGEAQ